jgi:phosphoenolpyruvate-protein kinase (PTS system EI component)
MHYSMYQHVLSNCLCSTRSCGTCRCPVSTSLRVSVLHCSCKMAEVMEELDAARDQLLDDADGLVGRVKDVKEVEKRLHHNLLQHNARCLIPFF